MGFKLVPPDQTAQQPASQSAPAAAQPAAGRFRLVLPDSAPSSAPSSAAPAAPRRLTLNPPPAAPQAPADWRGFITPKQDPEPTWGEVLGAEARALPRRFANAAHGIEASVRQSFHDPDGLNAFLHPFSGYQAEAREFAQALRDEPQNGKLREFAHTLGVNPDALVSDDWVQQMDSYGALVKGFQRRGMAADEGLQAALTAARTNDAEIAAMRPDVDQWSAKGLVRDIATGAAEMIPAVATTLVTKNPALGAGVMGGQMYGHTYIDSLNNLELDPEQARRRAALFTVFEFATEATPLKVLLSDTGRLSKMLTAGAAEGIQEGLTEILQSGHDMLALDQDMTIGEFANAVAHSMVVGAGVGAGLGAVTPGREGAEEDVEPNEDEIAAAQQKMNTADEVRTVQPGEASPVQSALAPGERAAQPPADVDPETGEVYDMGADLERDAAAQETQPPAPRLQMRASGEPFLSERSARASRIFKASPGAAVVPVEGGFAIQINNEPAAGGSPEAPAAGAPAGERGPLSQEEVSNAEAEPPSEKAVPPQAEEQSQTASEADAQPRAEVATGSQFDPAQFQVGAGPVFHVAKFEGKADNFSQLSAIARKNGGRYSRNAQHGAIPGFLFTDSGARDKFIEIAKGLQARAGAAPADDLLTGTQGAQAEAPRSAQFESYRKWIEQQKPETLAESRGMLEEMKFDYRLADGEDAQLEQLFNSRLPVQNNGNRNAQGVVEASAAAVPANDSGRVEIVDDAELSLERPNLVASFGKQSYPVQSIAEAQAKWNGFRSQSGAGASDIGGSLKITQDGKPIARISYNGRVWRDGQPTAAAAVADIDAAASEAATSPENALPEPSQAQKEAGNYKLGHVKVQGLDISIENPRGSKRSGVDPDGKKWEVDMAHHYGYIKRTEGADGDHVDVFVGPNPDSSQVYVVDQVDKDGKFDEHKVLMGFNTREEAEAGYLANYQKGWKVGPVTELTVDAFREWLNEADTSKPIGGRRRVSRGDVQALRQMQRNAKPSKGADEPKPFEREFNFAGGKIVGNARTVVSPESYKQTYGTDGGIVSFELKGDGVNSESGYKSVAGVTYTGKMSDERLEKMLAKVARENARDTPAVKPAPKPAETSQPPAAPKPRKPAKAGRERTAERQARLAAYFTPGNVVPGYGGFDRVLKYNPPDKGGAWSVDVESVVREGDGWVKNPKDTRVRNHSTLPTERELQKGAVAKTAVAEQAGPPADRLTESTSVDKSAQGQFAGNKIFTADKVEAARARLRSKLSSLNSGIDPEVMIDGMTIAGAYIESGVRKFGEFADAMVQDFGDKIRPYLLSFYEGARNYPGIDNSGMTSVDDARGEHAALMNPGIPASERAAVGEVAKPMEPPKRKKSTKAGPGEKRLSQDWGVEHLDGYSDEGAAAKASFLRESRDYLKAVASELAVHGYGPHGPKDKPVTVNESGIAGSGEASLYLVHGESGTNLYATIGAFSLRGVVPGTKQGVSVMARASNKDGDKQANKGTNTWLPVDLTAGELAAQLLRVAQQARPIAAGKVAEGQKPADNEPVPPQAGLFDEGNADAAVSRDDQGDDSGAVAEGGRSGAERASGRVQDAGPVGEDGSDSRRENAGGRSRDRKSGRSGAADAPGRARRAGNRAQPDHGGSALALRSNYRITDRDNLGAGGAITKARQNIAAIRIVKALKAEHRSPTHEELQALVKYTGWGSSELANNLFPSKKEPTGTWADLRDELKGLLTEEEYDTAARSTQYAHYTSKPIIEGIYRAIEEFGLTRGMAFEGGLGTGNFIGLIPNSMQLQYSGVEMDGISADIAQALYPEAGIIKGDFTKVSVPENYFDLTIGNPPFAGFSVLADPKYRAHKFKLHDYFIAKQIDAVRPGGIAVFVTSKGTMDKRADDARTYLAERANLLGAIRLPQTAFKENAGTEVVTDILFFQKKGDGIEDNGVAWNGLAEITTPEGPTNINQYFAEHPEMILGESRLQGSMYGANEYTVLPTGNIALQLAEAIDRLPKDVVAASPTAEELAARARAVDMNPQKTEGSYYLDGEGRLRQVAFGVGEIVQIRGDGQTTGIAKKHAQIIQDYIGVRDALLEVMKQQDHPQALKAAQAALNDQYDAFVKKHGPINQAKTTVRTDGVEITSEPIMNVIDMDPYAYQVSAIEIYDEDSGKADKHRVFFERVKNQSQAVVIESAIDALSVTLNEKGFVDMKYLAERYNVSEEQAVAELGDAVFQDPTTEQYLTDDSYLSGNVKAKLAIAREAAEQDSKFQRNVDALERVQPEDLPLTRIAANLGAHWIPDEVVESFATSVLDFKGSITSLIRGDSSNWNVNGRSENQRYATSRRTATEILSAALNRVTVKVYDTVYEGGNKKQELNKEETAAANQKVQELREEFRRWYLQDADASEAIHRIYNAQFNTTVPRKFNGDHLTLPRLSGRYKLHNWQKNGVWRVIQTGNTYLAHTVGAGKTLTSSVAAIELKRLGLARKPTFSVLKSTLKQFATEFLDAYPDAKLLVADEKQLDKQNLRKFFARLMSDEWDAVIMSHQAFEKIPMSPEFVTQMVEAELAEYQALLEEVDDSDIASRKQIERQIEAMEQRLEAMNAQDRKIAGINFEDTGIDFVFVDEAHHHKKVPFPTNQSNVKGVDPNGSNIAYDLYLKSRYLNTVRPRRNLVLMSGTPITNTLGELFNIQRYLQPHVLEAASTSSFDAWSSTFADTVTELEMQPSGNFKASTRLAKFVGVPALMRDFLEVADIVSDDDLKASLTIKRPKVKGGQRQIVAVPRSPELKAFQKGLAERITKLEKKKGPPKKGDDNILVVINDARKASIDLRLAGMPQTTPSKLDFMIEDVLHSWQSTSGMEFRAGAKVEPVKGATQLIFTEIGESNGFNVYTYIRDRLIERGVPAEQIAFIQDYETTKKKKKLFREMNTGVKRILLGGSKNLGTGTNVQQRLVRINHLDIDYLPANIIQREGRAIRQGNKNEEVEIAAYATEGTVDAFMWQLNETKQRMIDQVMSGNLNIDEVEDVSDNASQMAQAKALASGNPLLLEQAGLQSEVAKLRALREAHYSQRSQNQRASRDLSTMIIHLKRDLEEYSDYARRFTSTAGDKFAMTIFGKQFDDRKAAGEHIIASMGGLKAGRVGKLAGLDVYASTNILGGKYLSFTPDKVYGLDAVEIRLNEDADPIGLIRTLENTAKKFSQLPEKVAEALATAERRRELAIESANTKFQYDDDLAAKVERLAQIGQELASVDAPQSEVVPDPAAAPGEAPESRGAASARGLTTAAIERAISSKVAGWPSGPRVSVVPSLAYLPQRLAERAARAGRAGAVTEGLYDRESRTVFMVAAGIGSSERAEHVLAHEVVGHFAFERQFKGSLLSIYDDVARLSKTDPRLTGIAAEVAKLYPDATEQQQAAEIVAKLAEDGVRHPVIVRMRAALKRMLRVLGFRRPFSLNDLRDMLVRAAESLRAGSIIAPSNEASEIDPAGSVALSQAEPDFDPWMEPKKLAQAVANAAKKAPTAATLTKAGWKLEDWRAGSLQFLTRAQLVEIGGKVLPSMRRYLAAAKNMDADRNRLLADRSELADTWRKFAQGDPAMGRLLAKVMHEATIAGVDPAETYTPLTNAKETKERLKVIREKAKGRSGENTAKFIEEMKQVKMRLHQEHNREAAAPRVYALWNKLSPEAQDLYIEVRDSYSKHQEQTLAALISRINDSVASEKYRKALIDAMRAKFEGAKVTAPYFPLSRFGDYWVRVREGEDHSFHMFERRADQQAFIQQLRAIEPGAEISHGKKLQNLKQLTNVAPGFVEEVQGLLDKAGSGPAMNQLKDEIYQLYLQSLPDLSVRKHFIHRGKVVGYTEDAIRSFSHFMFHGSYQLARLRYSHRLEREISDMRDDIATAGNSALRTLLEAEAMSDGNKVHRLQNVDAIERDPEAATDFLNELQKRHEWAMSPSRGKLATFLSSFGFTFYLGVSPAAAMVNLTQTPMVALPVIGARYGFTKTAHELTKAVGDYFRGGFSVYSVLSKDEAAAFKVLEDSGIIDKTLAHDLAGMSEQGFEYNSTAHMVMNKVAFLFHHAERFNREITALAAYRLARQKGQGVAAAAQEAGELVEQSHFDYSNANKARFMQGDVATVLLMFRQFSQNMTYMLARALHQSMKGASQTARREAKRKLAGVLGMTFLFAGLQGLPMMWAAKLVLEAVFDDEDDPWIFEAEFRLFLAELTGSKTAGAVLARGPVDVATGATVSSRVSLNNIWLRESNRDLEGEDAYQYWLEQAAGPIGGAVGGLFTWADMMKQGQYQRAFEALLPVAIRNPLAAYRYADEGANTMRGDPLVPDMAVSDLLLKSIGFTPTVLSERYDENNAIKRVEQRILQRHDRLLDRYALAWRLEDQEGMDEAVQDIIRYNMRNPSFPITPDTVRSSLQSRQAYSDRARNGIIVNKRLQHLNQQFDFAE